MTSERETDIGPLSATGQENVSAPRVERRRELDLIRVFIVVGLIFFHTARIFDPQPWYVKNDQTSDLVYIALGFAATWAMPLLFFVAGMGIWYSLRSRSLAVFSLERVRRLAVPLLFGTLVIVPPQVWIRLQGSVDHVEPYWQFLSRFFDIRFEIASFPIIIVSDPATNLFEFAHLWFLLVLFLFTLLLLPVIGILRSDAGLRLIDRLAGISGKFWVILAAGLPIGILEATFPFHSQDGLGGWGRYSYILFLLYGYLLATDPRNGEAFYKHRVKALLLAISTFVIVGALFVFGSERPGANMMQDNDLLSLSMRVVRGTSGLLWIVAILGYGSGFSRKEQAARREDRDPTLPDRVASYMSEAVLPVFVLHQTVIVLLGFYLVQVPVGPIFKYLIICLTSLAAIFVIYEFAVRRTRLTRFLLGMKLH